MPRLELPPLHPVFGVCLLLGTGCSDLLGADFERRRALRNTAPVAQNLELRVVEGTTHNLGRMLATDEENDALTYRIATGPTRGRLTRFDSDTGEFVYEPSSGESGEDAFEFHVDDAAGSHSRVPGRVKVQIWPFGPIKLDPEEHRIGNTELGTSVVIEGDTALIGAEEKGAVYVARQQTDGTWKCVQGIHPPAEIESDPLHFGWSVALSGAWAMISAWGNFLEDPEPWPPPPGRVFFYKRNDQDVFEYAQSFVGPASRVGDLFGMDVSLHGTRAVASAHEDESVQPYELHENGTWVALPPIPSPDGQSDDSFGLDTALEGDTLAVSAPGHDSPRVDAGVVYVYAWRAGWQLEQKLYPVGQNVDGYQLRALALAQGRLLAGAAEAGGGVGAAYVFERLPSGGWSAPQPLPYASTANRNFGWTVALDGNLALIGMMNRTTFLGGAVLFRKEAAVWEEYKRLGSAGGDGFSSSLAVHGQVVAVGAVSERPAGAVFFYNVPEPGTEPKPSE